MSVECYNSGSCKTGLHHLSLAAKNTMAKLTNQFTGPGCKTILSVTKLTKIPAWESVGPGISNILKKSLGKHLCSKYEEHHSEIQINQNPKICTHNIVRGGVFVMQKELNHRQFTVPGIYQLKTPSIRIEETAFFLSFTHFSRAQRGVHFHTYLAMGKYFPSLCVQ